MVHEIYHTKMTFLYLAPGGSPLHFHNFSFGSQPQLQTLPQQQLRPINAYLQESVSSPFPLRYKQSFSCSLFCRPSHFHQIQRRSRIRQRTSIVTNMKSREEEGHGGMQVAHDWAKRGKGFRRVNLGETKLADVGAGAEKVISSDSISDSISDSRSDSNPDSYPDSYPDLTRLSRAKVQGQDQQGFFRELTHLPSPSPPPSPSPSPSPSLSKINPSPSRSSSTEDLDITQSLKAFPPILHPVLSSVPPGDRAALLPSLAPTVRPYPLKVIMTGKPVSGKGTYGPLLARKYGMVHVSTGALIRAEMRAGTKLGRAARERVANGDLLDEEIIASMLKARIQRDDCLVKGFILDGYPRTPEQAEMLQKKIGVEIDIVLHLDRCDEHVISWAVERMTDPATGIIYHPKFNPPPLNLVSRLERRTDDTIETVRKRLAQWHDLYEPTFGRWHDVMVTINTNIGRRFADVFVDISKHVDESIQKQRAAKGYLVHDPDRDEEEAEIRFDYNPERSRVVCYLANYDTLIDQHPRQFVAPPNSLMDIIRKCNTYDREQFLPFYIDTQHRHTLGYVGKSFAAELIAAAANVFDVQLDSCSLGTSVKGWAAANKGFVALVPELAIDAGADLTTDNTAASIKVVSVDERSEKVNEVLYKMWQRGYIRKWKDEMEALSLDIGGESMLHMDVGACPYFGVATFGIHVNGYIPATVSGFGEPRLWIARRSFSRPSCPGLLDQMVGTSYRRRHSRTHDRDTSPISPTARVLLASRPSSSRSPLTFLEPIEQAARAACFEEASMGDTYLPSNHLFQPVSAVRYQYETREGLCRKSLFVYDVAVPEDFVPSNATGAVEEFVLLSVSDAMDSLVNCPDDWKPNSALVMIDFAIRHGVISPDRESDYVDLVAGLRGCVRKE